MKIGFLNISDTRKEIRHMIKRLEKDKQYKIIEVSNIKSNQKNPKYCHVCIVNRNFPYIFFLYFQANKKRYSINYSDGTPRLINKYCNASMKDMCKAKDLAGRICHEEESGSQGLSLVVNNIRKELENLQAEKRNHVKEIER